jgi:hypothetical protein
MGTGGGSLLQGTSQAGVVQSSDAGIVPPSNAQNGSLLSGTPNPAVSTSGLAPAPNSKPVPYSKYTMNDVMSMELSRAVGLFRRDPTAQRLSHLQSAISAFKLRLRDPQWMPPQEPQALAAVKSLDDQLSVVSTVPLQVAEITGVNEFVAARLVHSAASSDTQVPSSSEYIIAMLCHSIACISYSLGWKALLASLAARMCEARGFIFVAVEKFSTLPPCTIAKNARSIAAISLP